MKPTTRLRQDPPLQVGWKPEAPETGRLGRASGAERAAKRGLVRSRASNR